MEEKLSFRCANCGETVEFQTLSNWRDAIRKDLDGRPRETLEFSLENTVKKCPKCGYVSFDVSKNILKDKSILESADYKEILNNKALPESVNKFLALGFVYEKQEEFYHSSHSYLCASWVLEKIGKTKESISLLEKTAYCLLRYINSNSFKTKINATALTAAVDVLRRVGKFENAKKLARFSLALVSDLEERQILIMEIVLCDGESSLPKEIPQFEYTASLKEIFETIQKDEYDSDFQKQFVFSNAAEYIKKCKLNEIADGVFLVVDRSKRKQLPDAILQNFIDAVNKDAVQKSNDPAHNTSRIINQSNYSERFGIKKELNEGEIVEDLIIENDNGRTQNEKTKDIDIIYLDDEFSGTKLSDEVETAEPIEDVKELEEKSEISEEVENSAEMTVVEDEEKAEAMVEEDEEKAEAMVVEDTEETDAIVEEDTEETDAMVEEDTEETDAMVEEDTEETDAIVEEDTEETDAIVEEDTEETDAMVEEDTEETDAIVEEDAEETDAIVEDEVETEETFETVEETQEAETLVEDTQEIEKIEAVGAVEDYDSIILMLAKFDGKISVGEVQTLFECSYTKAKELLDEIVKGGKLSWTTDEEVYRYNEK